MDSLVAMAIASAWIAGVFMFLSSGWMAVSCLAMALFFAGAIWLRSMMQTVFICVGAIIAGAYVASTLGWT